MVNSIPFKRKMNQGEYADVRKLISDEMKNQDHNFLKYLHQNTTPYLLNCKPFLVQLAFLFVFNNCRSEILSETHYCQISDEKLD